MLQTAMTTPVAMQNCRNPPASVSLRCKALKPRSFASVVAHNNVRGTRVVGRVMHRAIVCAAEINEAVFDTEVLQAPVPVLVDFWATWCGPCKLMAPLMDAVEKEYGGALKVVKVEADPNPGLIDKYKVYGLPTLILFKDGKVVHGSQREGAITKAGLLEYLERHGFAKVEA